VLPHRLTTKRETDVPTFRELMNGTELIVAPEAEMKRAHQTAGLDAICSRSNGGQ
jgi:hypothetical protein